MRSGLLAAAILLAAAPALGAQEEEAGETGFGPLHIGSLSPFQSLRAGLSPRAPELLPPGSFAVRHAETWANIWAFNEDDWIVDYEMVQSDLAFAAGLVDGLHLELEFQHGFRFEGHLDHAIEEFHDGLGLGQDHRDEYPESDFRFELPADGGGSAVSLDGDDTGSFSRALLTTLQYSWPGGGGWPAASASVTVRTDLGSADIDPHGLFDAGISLGLAKAAGDFHLYAAACVAWFGDEEFHDLNLRSTQRSAMLALEWHCTPETSILVQYLASEGAISDRDDFSKTSHELLLGAKIEFYPGTLLEAGLLENVILFDNGPDFGLHAGLTFRW